MHFLASFVFSFMMLSSYALANDSIKTKSIPRELVHSDNGIHVDIIESKMTDVSKDTLSKNAETPAKTKPANATLKKLLEQVLQQSVKTNDDEIEIDGLLVDDTRTKAGKDFYDLFYSSWEAPVSAKNYTITVSEKPFRFISTLIAISINENLVYQAVLQPRQDIMEEQTQDAIAMTQDYLANYEEIIKQLNGDDLSGSGIY